MGGHPQPPRVSYALGIGNDQVRTQREPLPRRQDERHLAKGQKPRHVGEVQPLLHHAHLFHRKLGEPNHHHRTPRYPLPQLAGDVHAGYVAGALDGALPHHLDGEGALDILGLGHRHLPVMERSLGHDAIIMAGPIWWQYEHTS